MSSSIQSSPGQGLGYSGIASKWGWFVALGVVLTLAGIFALGDVVAVTLVSTVFIGATLIVGGAVQVVHALMTKGWKAFALNLLAGLLYLAGGVLILQEPVQGSVIITILLLIAFMVGGLVRIVIAVTHRDLPGWWLMALGGVISLGVGISLYASLPWSGLWVLGTLVGIELIVTGVTWFQLGLALRRLGRSS